VTPEHQLEDANYPFTFIRLKSRF